MNVLLVHPIARNVSLSSPDLGLGFLAGALKKADHQVEILDCVNLGFTFKKFERYMAVNNFDVIGFRVFSSDLFSVKKSLEIIKNIRPETKIVLGGAHPSTFPEQVLQYFEEADFAIQGEAEKSLTDLVNSFPEPDIAQKEKISGLIWRNNGQIQINPRILPDDLDSLGSPDWELINPCNYPYQTSYLAESKIVAPLVMTRGCPFRCTFCSCRFLMGHKIRSHSVSYIINEIKFLKSNYGINEFCFIDDNFLVFKNHVNELCRQIVEQKLDIKWACLGVRLDRIDREILCSMEKSGCYMLTVGIESGSQKILDHMKKKLTLELINEKINLIIRETQIKIVGNFILGYPGETEEDIQKTIQLSLNLPLYVANFFPFHPVPGTEIYDILIDNGELGDLDWDSVMGQDRIPYVPRGISRTRFNRLFLYAFLKFYLRPRIILNVLAVTRWTEPLKLE